MLKLPVNRDKQKDGALFIFKDTTIILNKE